MTEPGPAAADRDGKRFSMSEIGVAQFSVCVMTGHRGCHSVTLAIS